jgi:hypothetical protein
MIWEWQHKLSRGDFMDDKDFEERKEEQPDRLHGKDVIAMIIALFMIILPYILIVVGAFFIATFIITRFWR